MQEGLITPAPGAVSCLSGGPGPQGRGLARARTTTTDLVYTVVIPAYNEGLRIGETLDRVTAYLRARGAAHEVLVVDDGSTDDTAQVVSRWAEKSPAVRLVRLDRNRGKGAALREGVARSAGRLVVVTDADMSTPIEDLERLEQALEQGCAAAFGSRAAAGAEVQERQSLARRILGRAGNLWIRALAAPGFLDTQCGFKLLRGPAARRLFGLCREEGFALDIELICLARRVLGERVAEVGVRWAHRDGSKVRWQHYALTFAAVPRIALAAERLRIALRRPALPAGGPAFTPPRRLAIGPARSGSPLFAEQLSSVEGAAELR